MDSSFHNQFFTQGQSESTQGLQSSKQYNSSAVMRVSMQAQAADRNAATNDKDALGQLPPNDTTTPTSSLIDPSLTNNVKLGRSPSDQDGDKPDSKIDRPTFIETVLGHVPPVIAHAALENDESILHLFSADSADVWNQRNNSKIIADTAEQVLAQFTSSPSHAQAVSQASKTSNGYGQWKIPKPSNKRRKSFVPEVSSSQPTFSHALASFKDPATVSTLRSLTLPRIPTPTPEGSAINKLRKDPNLKKASLSPPDQSSTIAHNHLRAAQNPRTDFTPPAQSSHEDDLLVRDEVIFQTLLVPSMPRQNHYVEAAAQNPIQYMSQGHQPSHWADPFTRLKCFVLDFALSPSLANKPHAAPPYFLPWFQDASQTCYMMEFSHSLGNMAQVAQAYDLTDELHKIVIKIKTFSESLINGYTIYSIRCSGEAYYESGNIITIGLEDGTFQNWEVEFGPSWRVGDYADGSMQYMRWETIITLLAMYAAMAFENDGSDRGEQDVRDRVAATDEKHLNDLDEELWLRISRAGGFGLNLEAINQMDIIRLPGELVAAEVAQMSDVA